MDDLDEDETPYAPNPNPHRHKPPLRNYSPSQFSRPHHHRPPPSDSDDEATPVHNMPVSDSDSDSSDDGAADNSGSSPDSRGKRRKLDLFAHGFEFAPRKPPVPSPAPETRNLKPGKNTSPPDWSEDATFVLLEAWGDLFVQNGRKSLRSDEWSEVAKKVNMASRIVRSESQCRNRLDTLKKKYKKEKIRLTEYPDLKSDWIYYAKMDSLMSGPSQMQLPPAAVRLPCGVDAGSYVFSSDRIYGNRANGMVEMRDSPGDTGTEDDDDDEDDDSDGLPPATTTPVMKRRGESSSSSASFRLLADSIRKFGEVYEKVEVSKRQQMVELERMRNDFQRDLEMQKRQILERAQSEIARMSQDEGEEDGDEERTDDDGGGGGDGGDDDDDMNGSAENMSG